MHKVIKIEGLDCAACAAELSEELSSIGGIGEAAADFINQRVALEYEGQEALARAIDVISHFEEVKIIDDNAPVKKERHIREIVSIAAAAALFVPALVLDILGMGKWVSFGLFLGSFLAAGWSVLWTVVMNVPKVFKNGFHPLVLLDENLLMTVAAAGAFAIGENMEGAAVMLLYQIGELLQSVAVGSSRGAITRLMQMKSASALRILGEETEEVDPEELAEGDVILVRKGDKFPADSTLLAGGTSLDVKSLTGESYLKEVRAGEEILAGSVNEGEAVKARVLRPYGESAVAKILELVESSSAKKAKPEKFITRFARIYTPIVVLLAVCIAVVPPLIDGYNFVKWLIPALDFLVISCPCALIISVPLTYFSGVGALARCGVLTKGAVCLDKLAAVKVAAFDKTGTLTEGRFSVGETFGDARALALAAAAEKLSSHPLAQAFADVSAPFAAEEAREIAGMGVEARIGNKTVLVGSARLLHERGIPFEEVESPAALVYVAEEGKYVGCVAIEDRIRPEAKEALTALRAAGVRKIAVLTGDTGERARRALTGLPLDEICAGLLPAEKPARAEALKADGALMYVGDGINDTPVMAASDVSVAMGGLGSDAAVEASDFVLAGDNLSALPKAVRGAKKTRKIVAENIVFSIAVKVALMALSVAVALPLWVAVLGDTGVMLLAVLNSMRMRAKLK